MLKRTLLAMAMIAASTTMATTVDVDPGATSIADASCRSAASTDVGCALRIAEPGSESVLPPADPVTLAPTSPTLEVTPPRDAGLNFKDAATDSVSVLHASLDPDTRHPLVPALLSLGALVVLLRKRPL